MHHGGWVYMMSDRYRGGIYTGVTSDLTFRVSQHRDGLGSQFVKRYGFTRLIYSEHHSTIEDAIAREKAIKKWRRAWKIELIEVQNPEWRDLYEVLHH
ncbi:MAG: GIY-YIG nuclease family protein [Pseudomonadota bacterium]